MIRVRKKSVKSYQHDLLRVESAVAMLMQIYYMRKAADSKFHVTAKKIFREKIVNSFFLRIIMIPFSCDLNILYTIHYICFEMRRILFHFPWSLSMYTGTHTLKMA